MKRTNIFSRWICVVMLLSCVHVAYGQTALTASHTTLTESEYILNDNLTITQTITVPENTTVILDLNGKVLQGNLSASGYVLDVKGTLTIKDSQQTDVNKGSINEDGLFVWDANGPISVLGGIICNLPKENLNTQGIKVSGTCTIDYANIVGCYTASRGGAVFVEGTGKFIMNDGEISYNYAGSQGGGIYGHFVTLKNSTFRYNVSKNHGGAIFVSQHEDNDDTRLSGELTIDNCLISYNFTGVFGGGLYSQVKTRLTNSTISHNWAMTDELEGDQGQGRGGGLCFVGNGVQEVDDEQGRKTLVAKEPIIEFTMENTTVSHNTAMFYGGGCQIHDGAKLILNSGNVEYNTVVLHGAGGLHFTNATTFDFNGGTISNNHAEYVGGAIHSSYSCILNMDGGVITGNTCNGRGGGVHVNTGGNLKLNGTSITENSASVGKDYRIAKVNRNRTENGTYVYSYTREENVGERVFTGYGGGVFLDCCTATMDMENGEELSRNHAESGGGGIALAMINMPENNKIVHVRVANFTLNNGKIQDNTTDGNGAGVYIMENKSKLDFDTKLENEGESGIYHTLKEQFYTFLEENIFYKTPAAFIHGGSMTENIAKGDGGALFVFGNVTMTDGSITQNEANNGGGICITDGKVEITKGEISNNTAESYGGGLYVINEKANEITLSGDGVFKNNTAKKAGGGMAVGGPVTFAFSGTLENNTAPNGGGIYLLPGTGSAEETRGAILNFNGGFIRNNTAVVDSSIKLDDQTAWHDSESDVAGVGGGVFLDNYTTLDFNVTSKGLGFYGNRATNAADDIFANGNGTKVELPDVSEMELSDFPIPAENLFWAEDYYSRYEDGEYENDVKYLSLLPVDKAPTFTEPAHNLRYRFALDNLKRAHIVQIPANTFKDRYVCLALGWEIFYVNIIKEGLKAGESAIFHIYPATDENSMTATPYITTILTGTDDNGSMVYRTVTLTKGYWGVKESNWSYTYDTEATTPEIRQIIADDKIDNGEGFKFVNTPKPAKSSLLHHEDKVRNIMGKKQE